MNPRFFSHDGMVGKMVFNVRDYVFIRTFIGFGYGIGKAFHFNVVRLTVPGAQDLTGFVGHGFNIFYRWGHE
jgi:hypothetical protein